jgi:hypothetical protein
MSLTASHFGNNIAQISSFFEDAGFLRCDTLSLGEYFPTFRLFAPENEGTAVYETLGTAHPTAHHHIPEGLRLLQHR